MSNDTLPEHGMEMVRRATALTDALREIDPRIVDPRPPFEGQERIIELEQEVAAWRQAWERAWTRVHEAATDHDLCESWDFIAAELGAPTRTRIVPVNVIITLDTNVPTDIVEGHGTTKGLERLRHYLVIDHTPNVEEVGEVHQRGLEGYSRVRHTVYQSFTRIGPLNVCTCGTVREADVHRRLDSVGVQFAALVDYRRECEFD